jgi:hypothetical protein
MIGDYREPGAQQHFCTSWSRRSDSGHSQLFVHVHVCTLLDRCPDEVNNSESNYEFMSEEDFIDFFQILQQRVLHFGQKIAEGEEAIEEWFVAFLENSANVFGRGKERWRRRDSLKCTIVLI